MIVINIQNIEDLILKNPGLHRVLDDQQHIIQQWKMSSRIPYLRSLKQKSLIDLLNSLNSDNIIKLEEYFKDTITLNKLNYKLIKNMVLEFDAEEIDGLSNFAITRDDKNIGVTFWR